MGNDLEAVRSAVRRGLAEAGWAGPVCVCRDTGERGERRWFAFTARDPDGEWMWRGASEEEDALVRVLVGAALQDIERGRDTPGNRRLARWLRELRAETGRDGHGGGDGDG